MEQKMAICIKFPVDAEGSDDSSVFLPNPDGLWSVVDSDGDEIATCRTLELAKCLEVLLNSAYEGEEYVGIEL